MILKLTDDREFYVTESQGNRIQESMKQGKDFILLPGNMVIKTKIIYSLLPGGDPAKTIEGQKRIAQPKRCIGKRSIQLEVSLRIRKEYGSKWPAPMRDKDLRNTYRLEIIEENDGEWCDAVAGTCVCYKPHSTSGSAWRDVFPDSLKMEVMA